MIDFMDFIIFHQAPGSNKNTPPRGAAAQKGGGGGGLALPLQKKSALLFDVHHLC